MRTADSKALPKSRTFVRHLPEKQQGRRGFDFNVGQSSQDLISHATERYRADGLFGVKAIGESGVDLARLVECLYLFRREAKSKLGRLSCS
jgi:hypothetical protein